MNDRVLADLAGDGDAPPRGDRGGNLRAALPLDIPRSASHDELWDRDTAGKAKDVEDVPETEAATLLPSPLATPRVCGHRSSVKTVRVASCGPTR